MCSIFVAIQLSLVMQVRARLGPSSGLFPSGLVDAFFDRALSVMTLNREGLDNSTLAKSASLRSQLPHICSSTRAYASASAWASHQRQFHNTRMQNSICARAGWPFPASNPRIERSTSTRAGLREPGDEGLRKPEGLKEPKPAEGPGLSVPRNVLGGELECCCSDCHGSGIETGFYRDGFCSTGQDDVGRHTVCVEVTDEFLEYSKSVGNDLSQPIPQYLFPGIEPGDRWCLCALRWVQAYEAGKAPQLHLKATHEKTLQHVDLDTLMKYAVDVDDAVAEVARLDDMRSMLERSFAIPSSPENH